MLAETELPGFRTKNRKRLAFIYPPYGVIRNEPGIKVVKENYGVFPSLSLLYAAGSAMGAGHEVIFLDINASPLTMSELINKLQKFQPDYLCFTLTTYQFSETINWIKNLKNAIKRPVIAGGVHLSIFPEESIRHETIDVAFTGECELSLPAFLECNTMDLEAFSTVPGLVFRKDEKIINTGPAPVLKNVDFAHFPARQLLDNSLYYSFISKYRNFTPFISSRGCPFNCIFCEQGGMKFRGRSPENILNEIIYCHEKLHIREFDFFDSSFTTNKKRVLAICQAIREKGPKIYWSLRSRVDCVDEEVLEALAKSGCVRIYYGIESASPEILKTLRKKTDIEQIRKTIALTNKVGINTFGYFMIGSPGETVATIQSTINFAKSLNLDYAQFSKVSPMPGTELYSMLMTETGIDYWRNYIKNPEKGEPAIPRPACPIPDHEIENWCRKAYLTFYYRPGYILKALLRIKSLSELSRSVRTAWQMLFSR
jgi:radical SAM superfamily enzyme YgiQ (UPF0313 family)